MMPGVSPRMIAGASARREAQHRSRVTRAGRFLDIPVTPDYGRRDSMPTRLEESLERDIERIRQQVLEMAALAERALKRLRRGARRAATASRPTRSSCATSTSTRRRRRSTGCASSSWCASSRSAVHLRFAYSTIKINLELERVGDYAESIARQILSLSSCPRAARAAARAVRRDGEPRDPDAARLDRGVRAPGRRARAQASIAVGAGGRRAARQAQRRAGRGAARAEDPAARCSSRS